MKHATDHYDLLVLGTGLAGMAAAAKAHEHGLRVAQAGGVGQSQFSSGLLDLLAVHPTASGRIWDDPLAAMQALVQDEPDHPYALLGPQAVEQSLLDFTRFLEGMGLTYTGYARRNARVITAAGTLKHTYRVPLWMWRAEQGLERGAPALLVDFEGQTGYNARLIAGMLSQTWPGLKTARVAFPGENAAYPEHMALSMGQAVVREKLARELRPHLAGVELVGFPAMLGIREPGMVHKEMERLLGVGVFEIPTMPPAVTGMRIKSAFEAFAAREGVRLLAMHLSRPMDSKAKVFQTALGDGMDRVEIQADHVILATGRFFGLGLRADRNGVAESVFGLPVHQPAGREQWHRDTFLDRAGHPVNRAGLRVDSGFRPLDDSGRPANERLLACGSILAHQDWMRQKCGAGLAIATAHAAVRTIVRG